MQVSIKNIRKEFRGVSVLKDVSLDIASGELVALLGPSGSGKTTLLRLIAGLDLPTQGAIFFGGEDALQKSVRERHIGFVFQHYALFKHMTVFDNVAFGLRVRPRSQRPDRATIENRVLELLELVQLDDLDERYPSQLSGGQRQRVALARALAIDPAVLLLDEPFGALDAQVRKDLRRWLRQLHDRTKHTTLFVTHDQEEALELADRVVVMNEGRIEQVGSPDEVYDSPATPFVHGFLGSSSLFDVTLRNNTIRFNEFDSEISADGQGDFEGPASLFVRSHDFELVPTGGGIPGTVEMARQLSGLLRIEVSIGGRPEVVTVELTADRLHAGQRLVRGSRVYLRPRRFGIFPR